MKNKTVEKLTTEELRARKEKLRGALFIGGALIVLFLGYVMAKLISGTWRADDTLGVIVLAVMVVNVSLIAAKVNEINRELKRRAETGLH